MLTIEQMTPEQKIGRVFCARRTHLPEDLEFTLELIKKRIIGAVWLDKYCDYDPEQTRIALQEAADYRAEYEHENAYYYFR